MGNLSPRPSVAFLGGRNSEDADSNDAGKPQIEPLQHNQAISRAAGPDSPLSPKKSGLYTARQCLLFESAAQAARKRVCRTPQDGLEAHLQPGVRGGVHRCVQARE